VLQEIVPSFQKQFRCRYPSLESPQCRFSTPPEICTTGRTPRCNWFQFSIHPAKPMSISRSLPDAAGCRTPDHRSRAGGRPRAAGGRVYGLWFASGRLDATRSHSKPRYEPMLPFTRGWCRPSMAGTRIRVSSTSPAAGDKMDHDVPCGDDFCLYAYGECLEWKDLVRLPSGSTKEETGRRPPLSEYRICTSRQKLHLRQGRLGCV
jgi:hypothetical protein